MEQLQRHVIEPEYEVERLNITSILLDGFWVKGKVFEDLAQLVSGIFYK